MLANGLGKRAVVVEDVVEASGLGGGLNGVNRVEGSAGAEELTLELEVGVEEAKGVPLRVRYETANGGQESRPLRTHSDVKLGRLSVEGEVESAIGSRFGGEDLTEPGANRIATGSVAPGEGLKDGEVRSAGPVGKGKKVSCRGAFKLRK